MRAFESTDRGVNSAQRDDDRMALTLSTAAGLASRLVYCQLIGSIYYQCSKS